MSAIPANDLNDNHPDKHSLNQCPAFCGQLQHPGLAVDFDLYVDFSNRETTADQARIELELEKMVQPQNRVLHVGIGNSQLAEKFAQLGVLVDGITVSETEKTLGEGKNIPDYQIFLSNKYHHSFSQHFAAERFDYIVDNNLASFTCCQYHFYQMLENYIACLKVGGKILTDQRGMDWALADPGFIMGFEQLSAAVATLPVSVTRLTDMVYAIELLGAPAVEEKPRFSVYAKRVNDDGESYIESFSPQ
ncbi:MAG: hypothetical protein ACI8WB_005065 [Phenylobacterium sp.]|jgi:hypothetical protein